MFDIVLMFHVNARALFIWKKKRRILYGDNFAKFKVVLRFYLKKNYPYIEFLKSYSFMMYLIFEKTGKNFFWKYFKDFRRNLQYFKGQVQVIISKKSKTTVQ